MKILILVLSYNEGVFADFMKAQQETWGNTSCRGVDVCYYYGGNESKHTLQMFINSDDTINHAGLMQINCADDYEMMHWKFKLALDAIDYRQYDLIFRTNSCSYIDKERLLKVAETLPLEKCYAGYHNGSYISGAGIFFSPDVLDIIKAELTEDPHGAEDVLYGEMLNGRVEMIAENSRVDATVEGVGEFPDTTYHWRFKTSNDHKDRYRDIANMYRLHNQLKGK